MNNEKEKKEISDEGKRISIEEFKNIEMIVGKILEAEPVPETDRLLRLTVDLGEINSRQIVSGIATFFPDPSVLHGKKCIFVGNLAPRTIRGLESDGMILAAHTEEGIFSLIVPEADVPAGTRLG